MKYILFLSDYATFSTGEIKANSSAFQWYARMPSVFEDHRKMVEQKSTDFQDALKVSCNLVILYKRLLSLELFRKIFHFIASYQKIRR